MVTAHVARALIGEMIMSTSNSIGLNIAILLLFVLLLGYGWDHQAKHVAAVQNGCDRPVSYDKNGDVICPQW